jgi:CubicO group peptidase (beta-lactamase class C family)
MSFRDLLSHRSCLESPDKEIGFGSIPTNLEYVYRTRYESEVCGHRGYYVYNNALYGFAAELIASFVDKSLEQMFKDFFVEVGMTDSMVVDLDGSYENLPNLAQGYYQRDGRIHRMNPLLLRREAISLGAGGVLSTATDMGKYMALHLNRGKIGTKQVVSSEAIGWMHTPSIHRGIRPGQSPDPGFAAPHVEYAYGLGLALARVNEFYTTGHAGNSPPYISDMRFYNYGNDQSIGVFITTNGPGGIFGPSNVPPASISAAIFDIVRTGTNQHKLNEYLKYQAPWTTVAGLASPGMGSKVNAKVKADSAPKVDSGRRIEFGEVVGLYGEKNWR